MPKATIPTLLFVHGFGSDRSTWQRQVEELSEAFDVVTIDLPGHGKSPVLEPHDLATLAKAVVEAKDRCAGSVIIVGHSMGARLALLAFRRSPADIAGLAFLDGSATRHEHSERLVRLLRERLRLHGMNAALRANVEEMFLPSSPVGLREAAVASALRLAHAFAEDILADLARSNAVEALQPVADAGLPVLAIQSTALGPDMKRRSLELGQTSPWGELVRQLIPKSRIRNVPGVGHFVHLEAADVVNNELTSFALQCSS